MKSRIALKLLAFFAASLLLFALVSGLMFRSLFTDSIKESKRSEMLSRAGALSETLGEALDQARSGGMRQGGMGAVYGNFVRLLTRAEPNLWVLDEDLAFLSAGRMMGQALTYDTLPEEAERLVRAVFLGRTAFSEGFSELAGAPTLTVGAPIFQDGAVVGALLLNDAVSGMDQAIAKGQSILLYSAAAALLLSFLLAGLLSYSFTRPINRMKNAAQRLSDGDYEAKTGVSQRDEIGQLALSLDGLSGRLREARDAGQRQEQQRKDFLANVSHELRTPVTVLRGSLEALCDGVVTQPDMVREYHQQMLKETAGLQRLVNDLMELARLQNDDFPIQRAPLLLQDVLDDALRSARHLAGGKGIQIKAEVSQTPAAFQGDYARLKQMLLIVLDNAVKFSPEKGSIHATMENGRLTIRDEGPGIPAEDLPYLFDRFHKSRPEGDHQGSGLGLTIARQIAQRHGMDLAIESRVGVGTAVTFRWHPQG
ncbi:MAG: sensor histidine kinase [Christensenellales bacterium]